MLNQEKSVLLPRGRVLVVDDEPLIVDILREFLTYEGHTVLCAHQGDAALKIISAESIDVLITDLKMPGMTGVELIRRAKEEDPDLECVVMTGFGTVETAIEAMKHGAFDYLLKPFKPDDVMLVIARVLERQRLRRENLALRELVGFYEMSEALSAGMPLDEQLALLLRTAGQNLGADAVSLQLVDEKNQSGFRERARFGEMRDSVTSMTVPLRADGRTLGILTAASQCSNGFTEGQRKGLAVFGSRASEALESARMQSELQGVFTQTLAGFARALETKDAYTHGHSDRVSMYSALIAQTMGLGDVVVDTVAHGGLMHDIGKIGLRSEMLGKVGRLTRDEYLAFKQHPVKGRAIIAPIPFLSHLVPCIYHHHESFDGRGYPDGLDGESIPLEARILSVADAYDAMTSNRPYRRAMPHFIAMKELARGVDRQFDPHVVQAFESSIEVFRSERISSGLPVPR